ncbi:ethyl tert-butyl ether degradation protein EthD [Croceicoccus estronivorus]|uniref:EthD domain-containing protein n=1 Tax=Croceicoccus estronivorus TaxID=1172626 RepID=UPI00082F90B6|nr:EthD domain-containing protein [Croceicoccus estronivorus]OCC25478.1 ethyl tert-butyl ether degradation protein EthD [Croceicoccus estronivorus]
MIKCIALLKRKPDLTREQFIEYYEKNHAPLILSLLPDIIEYRRNFFQEEGAFTAANGTASDVDVVTEICLKDKEAHQRFLARSAEPDVAARIAADEENFLDRGATRMFVVDVHASKVEPA